MLKRRDFDIVEIPFLEKTWLYEITEKAGFPHSYHISDWSKISRLSRKCVQIFFARDSKNRTGGRHSLCLLKKVQFKRYGTEETISAQRSCSPSFLRRIHSLPLKNLLKRVSHDLDLRIFPSSRWRWWEPDDGSSLSPPSHAENFTLYPWRSISSFELPFLLVDLESPHSSLQDISLWPFAKTLVPEERAGNL